MEDGSSCIMFGIQLLAVIVVVLCGGMAAISIMFGIQLLAVMVVGGGVGRTAAVELCLEYSCWQ